MALVLIIDDDPLFCEMFCAAMQMHGHEAEAAHTLRDGRERIALRRHEVVFLDVRLPDGNGIDLVASLVGEPGGPEVVVITAAGDPAAAELAINSGAWDYVQKPASIDSMRETLERALCHRARRAQAGVSLPDAAGIVGESQRLRRCITLLAEAASSESTVLLTGETGTGKELFARAIHRNSPRATGPFVAVDCAVLSPSLIESELFGHQRGAFTGAVTSRLGLVKQADGGTLFLDEVGELPLDQQRAFLRVLQERRFRPVGGSEEVTSDFRLVAATNRNLWDMVGRGAFRQDLLYRLQGFMLALPPLRERAGDVALLAAHHTRRICERLGIPLKAFSPEMLRLLEEHPWPGNVRELVSVVEMLVLAARQDRVVSPEHLPAPFRVLLARARVSGANGREAGEGRNGSEGAAPLAPSQLAAGSTFEGVGSVLPAGGAASDEEAVTTSEHVIPWKDHRQQALDRIERDYLVRLLRTSGGRVTRAGQMAGLSRQRLYALLRKHGMVRQWKDEA